MSRRAVAWSISGSARSLAARSLAKDSSSLRGAPSRTTIKSEAAPKFLRKSLKRFATAVFWGSNACREV